LFDDRTSFVCGTCGARHEGFLTDTGFKLPDEVFAIPEPDREKRAQWDLDACVLDSERFFLRCILRIPFQALQAIWPDLSGKFPWEHDYTAGYRQPMLGN